MGQRVPRVLECCEGGQIAKAVENMELSLLANLHRELQDAEKTLTDLEGATDGNAHATQA